MTPEVFTQLEADIAAADEAGDMTKEIGLTEALETVRKRSGMIGFRMRGLRYDMGNQGALINTITEFSKKTI